MTQTLLSTKVLLPQENHFKLGEICVMSFTNQMLRLIPPGVNPEAICLMDDIMDHKPVLSREGLSAAVFERLEDQFEGDALDKELERLHLSLKQITEPTRPY